MQKALILSLLIASPTWAGPHEIEQVNQELEARAQQRELEQKRRAEERRRQEVEELLERERQRQIDEEQRRRAEWQSKVFDDLRQQQQQADIDALRRDLRKLREDREWDALLEDDD